MTSTITRLKAEISDLLLIPTEIDSNFTLDALGADSLDRVDLSCVIEDEFSILIDESEIPLTTTVAELAAMIDHRLES